MLNIQEKHLVLAFVSTTYTLVMARADLQAQVVLVSTRGQAWLKNAALRFHGPASVSDMPIG